MHDRAVSFLRLAADSICENGVDVQVVFTGQVGLPGDAAIFIDLAESVSYEVTCTPKPWTSNPLKEDLMNVPAVDAKGQLAFPGLTLTEDDFLGEESGDDSILFTPVLLTVKQTAKRLNIYPPTRLYTLANNGSLPCFRKLTGMLEKGKKPRVFFDEQDVIAYSKKLSREAVSK